MTGPLLGIQVGKADLAESKIDQQKGNKMRALTVIPDRDEQRNRPKHPHPLRPAEANLNSTTVRDTPAPVSLQRHPRPHTHKKFSGRVAKHIRRAFTPLIDAKAASTLLGVPYTWLLAQARAGNIPHHRLGHYVRFDPDDLQTWLREERIGAPESERQSP
jgi:excisionase family DNA binding protein